MKYEPTFESVHQHKVPQWYNDAKFGIFIHWSLFSVPAFAAEQTRDMSEQMAESMSATFANNPYAEWYLNSLRIPGSPTQAFHKKHYGDKSYFDFQRDFEEQNRALNVDDWAKLIEQAGAKYCVLVTKHHDGYTLWPTNTPNPRRANYFSSRDFVGELTDAIRARGMKMGLYYSGVFDWTFKTECAIDSMRGFLEHQNMPADYLPYSVAHLRELIDRYSPSILWNDIAFPYGYDLNELFAYYYNSVPDGVINDRWNQTKVPTTEPEWEALLNHINSGLDAALSNTTTHYDFTTPEYRLYSEVRPQKWECTRGIGRSFGFNRTEAGMDYLTGAQIIEMLVQIVSRNGNLLLNIGPRADGSVPYEQVKPLLEVGEWLKRNGEAIFATRPNTVPECKTSSDKSVCFTQSDTAVYAIALDSNPGRMLTICNAPVNADAPVEMLGLGTVPCRREGDAVVIELPESCIAQPAYAFKFRK